MSSRIQALFLFCLLSSAIFFHDLAQAQFLTSPYFEKIHNGKPLVVALANNTPPFCLLDEEGKPNGLDVELAQILGKTLGAELQFVYPEFKEIFSLVENGTVDLAIANITITMDRAQHVGFSHSYLDITQGALLDRRFIPRQIIEGVVKDVSIRSFADLEKIPGLKIGTWGNTTSAQQARAVHPEMEHRSYPDILAARQALRRGEINAIAADSPIIQFIANYYRSDRKRFKTLTRPTTKERLAIAMRMGDPSFAEFLNEFVDELRANGTMDRLVKKYIDDTSWAGEVLR